LQIKRPSAGKKERERAAGKFPHSNHLKKGVDSCPIHRKMGVEITATQKNTKKKWNSDPMAFH
jgi:hypothetical protein